MNSKQRCLNSIAGKKVDRTPVFPLLMSFAAKRIGASYRQFASDAQVLAQSQLNIFEKFNVDAVTACSDAFRVSADLGGEMVFPEEHPPHLAAPLVRNLQDLNSLKRPDVSNASSRMYDRAKAVECLSKNIGDRCMVAGWVDMPFAESCSICGVSELLMLTYENQQLVHTTLEFLTDIVIDFALLQIESGAHMVGAGDAAASLISPEMYREFALPYEKRVIQAVHNAGGLVKLHICGNTSALLEDMVKTDADLFNVDHMVDFDTACCVYGKAGKCFKGNLDPVADILQATPQVCAQKAKSCIQKAKDTSYMLSAGCEIPADVPDEVFEAFCDSVQ
ncbi:MAG: uroporphyrinogen decarboxylase family protein [Sedimentisphaeraceae bacterium JB056]